MRQRASFTTGFHIYLICGWGLLAALGSLANVSAQSAPPSIGSDSPTHSKLLRSKTVEIPFDIDQQTAAKTATLFVSGDGGQKWNIVETKQLPFESFRFEATKDGEYWFTHCTDVDPSIPHNETAPEERITIDSTGPTISLEGEADLDGSLIATLRLDDPNRISSLRILYVTDSRREWITVPNSELDQNGRFVIVPQESWRTLNVHISCTDSLYNKSAELKSFRRPRVVATEPPNPSAPRNKISPGGITPGTQPYNRLRTELKVQTAAGPSDPPQYFFNPGAAGLPGTNQPITSGADQPAARPGVASGVAGPMPGVEAPLPAPGTASRPSSPSPQPSRGLGTFGSAFGGTLTRQSEPAAESIPVPMGQPEASTGNPEATSAPAQPETLPSSGVEARVTPNGLEVVSPPQPESSFEAELPPPSRSVETETAPLAPKLNPPATRDPAAPITESVRTPKPELDTTGDGSGGRSRSLSEALRPMQSDRKPAEIVPTPRPEAVDRQEVFRARSESNEARNRDLQQAFDLAQLDRRTPFRFSDSNRFSLEYELEAIGALGARSVELYGSIDGGETWKRWGDDPDGNSPFDIETKGEGVFSFRIVVLGNNGLSSPRPLAGDLPDIAVIVDQTLPEIRITAARYGDGNRTGSLIVDYECEDDYLMNRPIALSFSDSLEGPWTTIAAGLRNEGRYIWPADPKLPPQIYLRMDATDKAGNIGTYLLDQPIATGGLAPRAKILGFRSR